MTIEKAQPRVSTRKANRSSDGGAEDLAKLVEEIRGGDREAEIAFFKTYADGIRYVLKRQLGEEKIERRLQEVQCVMLNRIRRGWAPESGRVAPLIYEAVAVCGFAQSPSAEQGADAKSVAAIKQALRGLSTREREALTRYYLRGEDAVAVRTSLGFSEKKFESLIARLKDSFAQSRRKAFAAGGHT